MDFNQRKLTKMEWESIEVPVSADEKEILQMIVKSYNDLNSVYNNNQSLMSFMKMDYQETIETYLYNTYFMKHIEKLKKKYNLHDINTKSNKKDKNELKKSDMIRINANDMTQLDDKKNDIYEFVLLELAEKLLKNNSKNNERLVYYYYTLVHVIDKYIKNPNNYVKLFIYGIIEHFKSKISLLKLVTTSHRYIEKNPYLLRYSDIKLYDHQKHLFQIFNSKNTQPKLVLYTAPTATGKTMSPLGLSEKHKIIFVCAARHVGIALAKSALSIQKKVAFAFGCKCTEDIRLHYFATSSFVKNDNTGHYIVYKDGKKKTDHTDGRKVEIMVCDIQSYIYAMYYMCQFHVKSEIITFWDEPTISLDYENHENHSLIHDVWANNEIPNIVLSSATLPKQNELHNVVRDYITRFEGRIYSVSSSDCKKTIPLINHSGNVIMPHSIAKSHSKLNQIVRHIQDNGTLLRYLDLYEIGRFIDYVLKNNILDDNESLKLENYFEDVKSVNMENVKSYYIDILSQIDEHQFANIVNYFENNRELRIGNGNKYENTNNIGMYITTKDAHTLTDGPTIFMTKAPEAIGKFCIQQANIPEQVLQDLNNRIHYNTQLGKKIDKLDREIEYQSTINTK